MNVCPARSPSPRRRIPPIWHHHMLRYRCALPLPHSIKSCKLLPLLRELVGVFMKKKSNRVTISYTITDGTVTTSAIEKKLLSLFADLEQVLDFEVPLP